ncbi:hypothetical protein DFH07DRAFT_920785 [Mycena maculata]|uniref:NAD(P)-binding protein n=1 Tax=Mycena maculata TaxID=230809 RepID=A0AAD7J1L2_9AGAR|nr:hypothetical protein DFH07DRAFT_920785 [Mycena maculata]
MASYVVTGAARGIGLEYVAQLSADANNTVFALVRNKATATRLESLPGNLPGNNITILEADVTDPKALENAAKAVSGVTGGKLDYLINNAALVKIGGPGLTQFTNPDDLEKELLDYFRTNTVGTVHCINAFLPLLQMGSVKKVITITTGGADTEFVLKAKHMGSAGYSISKAAVNMVVAKYAAQFKSEGFVFLALSPGFVDTSTLKAAPETVKGISKTLTQITPAFKGAMTPQQSVKLQLEVIYRWTVEDTGAFVSHHGNKAWL